MLFIVVVGWCCLLCCVACCLSLFVACLVVLCDGVVCRLRVVGSVFRSCLWCVGVVVVCRRCWLLWLMGGVCVDCCCSLLPGVLFVVCLSLFVVVVVVGVCCCNRVLLGLGVLLRNVVACLLVFVVVCCLFFVVCRCWCSL